MDKAKGVWKNMGLARGKALGKEEEKERGGGSSLYRLKLVMRATVQTVAVNLSLKESFHLSDLEHGANLSVLNSKVRSPSRSM